jgi:hypothetical protein
MLFAGAGCVSAGSSATPKVSPGASHSETAPSSASWPATSTATPAATYDVSNVPPAPTGEWKSIHWVEVPAASVTALLSPDPGASVETIDTESYVAGWSRGFVGFSLQTLTASESRPVATLSTSVATIATTYSSDGVHWHDGSVMRQPVSFDNLQVVGLFEGPSGLLAVGASGACGDSWIEALWTSPDGVSWQQVDTKKAFGQAVIENVSGGSSGFVAVDETGRAAWTSRDGQSWRPVKLDTPVSSRIDDGTAFSGGYVLVGSTEAVGARSCVAYVTDGSAPPTPAPPMRSPAVWWSPDGATWTKAELPGATSAYSVQMHVCRANDRTLVALADYSTDANSGSTFWISNDGRTWKSPAAPSGLSTHLLTDGQHGLLVVDPQDAGVADAPSGNTSISMVTDDGGLVALAQQGDRPPYNWKEQWAVGPTGILWTDGSRLWIGLPSGA